MSMLPIKSYEASYMQDMGIPQDPTKLEVNAYADGTHVDHFGWEIVVASIIMGGVMAGTGYMQMQAADKAASQQSKLGAWQAQQQKEIAAMQVEGSIETAEKLSQVANMVMTYPLAEAYPGYYSPEATIANAYISAFPVLMYTSATKPDLTQYMDDASKSLVNAQVAVDEFVAEDYESMDLEKTVTNFYNKNRATMENAFGIQMEEGEQAIRAAQGGSRDARPWAVKAATNKAQTDLHRNYIQGMLQINDKNQQSVIAAKQQELDNEYRNETLNVAKYQAEIGRLGAAYSYAATLMGQEAQNWQTEMEVALQCIKLYTTSAQSERSMQWQAALQDQELELKQLVAAAGLMEGASTVELNGILTAAQTRAQGVVLQAQQESAAIQSQYQGTANMLSVINSAAGAIGGAYMSNYQQTQLLNALNGSGSTTDMWAATGGMWS